MQYINGTFGLLLVLLTIVHFDDSDPATWIPIYATGAILALTTLIQNLPRWAVWVLAIVTTAAMFFYFFGFFKLAPELGKDWYWRETALDAWGLLFAANAMIFVLSDFSCRMKAEPGQTPVKRAKSLLPFPRRLSQTRQQTP